MKIRRIVAITFYIISPICWIGFLNFIVVDQIFQLHLTYGYNCCIYFPRRCAFMLTLDARFERRDQSRDRFTGLSASTLVLSVETNHVTDAQPTNERVRASQSAWASSGKAKLGSECHVDRSRDWFWRSKRASAWNCILTVEISALPINDKISDLKYYFLRM